MKALTPAARSKARRFVLQALYQMQLTGNSAVDVEQQLIQDHDMKRVDKQYLHELLSGITSHRENIDTALEKYLERKISELDPVEYAALSVGAYELVYRIDIPYRVAINEGVELAKQFGATESHKLVNSVLDRIARESRTAEVAGRA